VRSQFERYVGQLRTLYREADRILSMSPPATDAELVDLERQLGWLVPSPLRSAWLVANGGEAYSPVFARPGRLTGHDFLSVEQALAECESLRRRAPSYEGYEEPDPRGTRIKEGWYQPGWLPFAGFGGGSLLLMIDVTPGSAGTIGQVISYTHDPDQIEFVAASFEEFLERSAEAIAVDANEYLLT